MTNYQLTRRGFHLGEISRSLAPKAINLSERLGERWAEGKPCLLKYSIKPELCEYHDAINQSEHLVQQIYQGFDLQACIESSPYSERLLGNFESLGSSVNEGEKQEIESVAFDALVDEEIIAEDLWLKASWLSFHEEDASLRFRFSFGIDHVEDVAADPNRQQYAARLADSIFPESALITQHAHLHSSLCELLNCRSVDYVERIIYFNAPNGGAYLHHDLERGHAGVVFAQLTGKTFWLALPKTTLLKEIVNFVSSNSWPETVASDVRNELIELAASPNKLELALDSFSNDAVIHLINETKEFVQLLIDRGHGISLDAGDVLLLPQSDAQRCCWHSVFCLGDEVGQGLSFAVKPQ